ncbi:MAG: hypothetical protein ACOC7L_03515 [Acidobacteriota bacterium]
MPHPRLVVLSIAVLALFWAPAPARAGVYLNTFEAVAFLAPDGRAGQVTVKLGCDRGERFRLRVTVSQRATGAVAEGRARGVCTGDRVREDFQLVPVPVRAVGDARFDEALSATVAGLAITTVGRRGSSERTDLHQWIPDFQLRWLPGPDPGEAPGSAVAEP